MKSLNTGTKAIIAGAIAFAALAGTTAKAEEIRNPDLKFVPKMRLENKDMVRIKMGYPDSKKKESETKLNAEVIRSAIEKSDYALFTKTLTDAGITENITEAQFKIIVSAYTKAKAGDIAGAQTLLKENNMASMLNRFIMGKHLELTDAQKDIIKQAEDLVKAGKLDEAKKVLESAGLPAPSNKIPARPEEVKAALEKARTLRAEGKNDEAEKILLDTGISSKAVVKIEKEFDKENLKERKSILQKIKHFFKFGKNQ